ncbi:MAG: acetyl-CoA C-acetyltransferase [Bdellovibrionales bacterium]
MFMSKKVALVAGSRIPFTKSFSHYQENTGQELMTAALKDLVEKTNLKGKKIDDVALGAVMMHGSDWNISRECSLGSGLSPLTPAYDIRRACGTSLETVIAIANKIKLGQARVGIAGGFDTNSDAPIEFKRSFAKKLIELNKSKTALKKISSLLSFKTKDLKPQFPGVVEPRTGKSMGQHCELMAKEWKISREDQDQLAFESHQKASKAYDEGFYDDLVCEFNGVKKDSIVRPGTTIEKLSTLRPAFDKSSEGTLTAGNSTALTDGASCVLLADEDYAKENNLPILAYFVDAQVAAFDFVKGEGLLMAPTMAVAELLKRNKLTFDDFDFFEIHEAFAAQALSTFKAWEDEDYCKNRLGLDKALGSIPREKLNIKGGSLAVGHPFGGTGARISASLSKILNESGKGRGLISICTGGGMGVAAIFEK